MPAPAIPPSAPLSNLTGLPVTIGGTATAIEAALAARGISAAMRELGPNWTRPLVIVAAGQSNALSQDNLGDHTNPANTFVVNWDPSNPSVLGTALVPAVYGTNPYNVGWDGAAATNTATATQAYTNSAMSAAQAIRANGYIDPSRPIIIVPDYRGAQSIADWVDGAPVDMWAVLVAHLTVVKAAYPNAIIDYVLWDQGENDNATQASFQGTIAGTQLTTTGVTGTIQTNWPIQGAAPGTVILSQASGTTGGAGVYNISISQSIPVATAMTSGPYGTDALYLGAFTRLIARLRGLAMWSSLTRMGVTELGTWNDNAGQARNRVLRSMRGGNIWPFVTFVTGQGLTESLQNPGAHYDGVSQNILGQRHARAWMECLGGQFMYGGNANGNGSQQSFANTINGPTSGTLALGKQDITGGLNLVANGGNIILPNPSVCDGEMISIYVAAVTTLTTFAGSVLVENSVSVTNATTVTLKAGFVYWLFTQSSAAWFLKMMSFQNGNWRRYITSAAYSAGTSQTFSSQQLNGVAYTFNGGTATIQPTFGNDAMFFNSSGTLVITTSLGSFYTPNNDLIGTTLTLNAGETVWLQMAITGTNSLAVYVMNYNGGVGTQRDAPATGATITSKAGYGRLTHVIEPPGSIASLTITLPANPKDGQQVVYVATQQVTNAIWTGGTVAGSVPSSLPQGIHLTLTYVSSQAKWY